MIEKSPRQRVYDHGEVFTPPAIVDRMIRLLEEELGPYDARVLEPACGSGNFLVPILEKKLASIDKIDHSNQADPAVFGLHALMAIYGIELLADNVERCRSRLADTMLEWAGPGVEPEWLQAVKKVIEINIVHGDALSLTTSRGDRLRFSEWSISNEILFERREFEFADLLNRAYFGEGTLFESVSSEEMFIPLQTQRNLSFFKIASLESC